MIWLAPHQILFRLLVILFWTFYFIPIIATVIIAVTINKTVAITDLNDERAMPQIPCPLVHPLATFVPIPTSSPPAIITVAIIGIK